MTKIILIDEDKNVRYEYLIGDIIEKYNLSDEDILNAVSKFALDSHKSKIEWANLIREHRRIKPITDEEIINACHHRKLTKIKGVFDKYGLKPKREVKGYIH